MMPKTAKEPEIEDKFSDALGGWEEGKSLE